MDSLFAQTITKPLADRMRPRRLSDFAGQEKALGPGSPLRRMIERDALQRFCFTGRREPAKLHWHILLPI